jgi:hypothetical protein
MDDPEKQEDTILEENVEKQKHAMHERHHEKRHKKHALHAAAHKPKKRYGWIIAAVLVIAGVSGLFGYMILNDKAPAQPVVPTGKGAVALDFYVMSQCPYGVQVEDAIKPVLDKLGPNVKFSLNFIATDNGDGTFSSLHGQNEVDGNIVQLCAKKYAPAKYMDLVACMNENPQGIPGNWEACAKDMPVDKIKACFTGDEGKELLKQSIAASNTVNARGSPTMYLAGELYSGGRKENDFLRAICGKLTDKPEACKNIPEPAKVNVIVLSDKRCAECDTTGLESSLKGIFPGMVLTRYDYGDPEGKKLYQDLGLKALPAFLFDDTVAKDENYANVQNYLEAAGTYKSLKIGAEFDPAAEICDNEKDDDGNGKTDCSDSSCSAKLVCREEKPKNLGVFIMSDCPYGKLAVKALKEVVDNFNNQISFEVHYIADDNGDGTFSSLHGAYEAEEDMVQLCVKKYSPAVWLDYLYCRSDKGIKGIDWKGCAQDNGVDIAKVESCSTGDEGKDLLRQDIKLAQGLGISASPTWLANNKYQFSGIAAEAIKQSFCKYNNITGCANTLSGAAAPSGNCG